MLWAMTSGGVRRSLVLWPERSSSAWGGCWQNPILGLDSLIPYVVPSKMTYYKILRKRCYCDDQPNNTGLDVYKGGPEPVGLEILGLITVAIGVLILANWVDRRR